MRTVEGPTDSVVVVGAGLGGLSAALRLAAAGRRVTVLEREPVPGGRCGLLLDGGYAFDTGPSVLTMPDLIADCFDAVGERMEDWLDLQPVDPVYRACFADGSVLDAHADPAATAEEIAGLVGTQEANRYRRFVDYICELYRVEQRHFIDRNLDSPLALLSPALARLVALGGFRRLAPTVARYLHDERTQRLFSFQAMYAGLSPFDAYAIYAVIAYMDSVAGVYFPRGGMHALPRALAGAAVRHGVELRFGVEVTRVERRGRRAVAVRTADGERIPADAVGANPDLPVARRDLLGAPLRRPLRYSPSCALLLVGSSATYAKAAHHTIHFRRAWRSMFRELVDEEVLPRDPSFLVSNPTRADPALAPAGREIYSVLFMTPNLHGGQDWSRLRGPFRDTMVAALEREGYVGFGDEIEVEHLTTPLDWAARGMQAGAPFAAAHTFSQTGPFRPRNLWGDNVVFTGSGTQPGVGVPMVLVSGRLAAERILGPDPAYRSRAWR